MHTYPGDTTLAEVCVWGEESTGFFLGGDLHALGLFVVVFFFFQTANTLSTNTVSPKTFLVVLKHTQKPKGVARLVTPVAPFYCYLRDNMSIPTDP